MMLCVVLLIDIQNPSFPAPGLAFIDLSLTIES